MKAVSADSAGSADTDTEEVSADSVASVGLDSDSADNLKLFDQEKIMAV